MSDLVEGVSYREMIAPLGLSEVNSEMLHGVLFSIEDDWCGSDLKFWKVSQLIISNRHVVLAEFLGRGTHRKLWMMDMSQADADRVERLIMDARTYWGQVVEGE